MSSRSSVDRAPARVREIMGSSPVGYSDLFSLSHARGIAWWSFHLSHLIYRAENLTSLSFILVVNIRWGSQQACETLSRYRLYMCLKRWYIFKKFAWIEVFREITDSFVLDMCSKNVFCSKTALKGKTCPKLLKPQKNVAPNAKIKVAQKLLSSIGTGLDDLSG